MSLKWTDTLDIAIELDEAYRVTRRGRRGPAGGNLYADQPTIRAMFALSRVTGEPGYAEFALGLPGECFVQNGRSRYLFRSAVEDY